MKRNISWLLAFMAMCILLTGCKNGKSNNKEKDVDLQTEDSTIITWVCLFYPGIPAENQKEINRILQEKGMDYQINFLLPLDEDGGPLTGAGYAEWVDEYEQKRSLDIITSGAWPAGVNTDISFVKQHMIPLDSYLETEEGKGLREKYTEGEWKQVSLEGNAYVIPSTVVGSAGEYGLDTGVYLSINEQYKKYFDEFDGTYNSLRQIYHTIGDENLKIVIPGLPGIREVYGLMGYSTLNSVFAYSQDEKCVVDVTKTEEIPNLLHDMYADLKEGILINQAWTSEIPQNNVLAYIYSLKSLPRVGFVDYQLASGINELNVRAKYGISVNSKKKSQAFQVLCTCFTDPDILCLLYPGADKELVVRRKEILSSYEENELSGFFLEFDERQTDLMQEAIVSSYLELVNSIQQRNENSEDDYDYELNPKFDSEAEWKKFLASMNSYSDLCEYTNQKLTDWAK